ncbi:hypothetical protein DPSP01_003647 [Paraphaeosphaeria sporulosa]
MMDATVDADADELLFEPFLPSPPDSYSWDPSEQNLDDKILQGYLEDSQPISITELGEDGESSHDPVTLVPDRDCIIGRIEDMLERIVDGLLAGNEQLTIKLKTRSGLSRRHQDAGTIPSARDIEISYPGNNAQDARRFTIVVRILELIHGCLIDDVIVTKRDMYYRHPELFGKQPVVDRYVDGIACTLGVPRSLLNVTAAAKGLVAGNFVLSRADGTSMHGLSEPEGILVPTIQAGDVLDMSAVHWILVIEKEVRLMVASTS